MQDRPVCFSCEEEIERNSDMVFESPCGCGDHASAVFHAICLFDWRDRKKVIKARIEEMRTRLMGEQEEDADD
jgi:hypothetical protein